MNKKIYIEPSMKCTHANLFHVYMAGENSIPYGGGTGGGGDAEGKGRNDENKNEKDDSWGDLW